jgi:hypothetical protein
MKIRQVEAEIFHADLQDRHKANNRFSQLGNRV